MDGGSAVGGRRSGVPRRAPARLAASGSAIGWRLRSVQQESIEALCPNISRDKVLAALGELRDQNKCGPIDENNEIYKL